MSKSKNSRTNVKLSNRKQMPASSADAVYVCGICQKVFSYPQTLKRHMKVHTDDSDIHKCGVCGKCLSRLEYLEAHMRTHTGDKPFICEESDCYKAFADPRGLHRHKQIHKNGRIHKCSICDRSFVQMSHMVTHMRTHTGERPYSCSTCLKSFTQIGSLEKHRRSHSEDRPFQCDICHKFFKSEGYLKTHQRRHTGVDVMACPVCDRSISDTYSLKRHMLLHDQKHQDKWLQGDDLMELNTDLKQHLRHTHQTELAVGGDTDGEEADSRSCDPAAEQAEADVQHSHSFTKIENIEEFDENSVDSVDTYLGNSADSCTDPCKTIATDSLFVPQPGMHNITDCKTSLVSSQQTSDHPQTKVDTPSLYQIISSQHVKRHYLQTNQSISCVAESNESNSDISSPLEHFPKLKINKSSVSDEECSGSSSASGDIQSGTEILPCSKLPAGTSSDKSIDSSRLKRERLNLLVDRLKQTD